MRAAALASPRAIAQGTGVTAGNAEAPLLPPPLVPVARAILEQDARNLPSLRLRLDHGELGVIEISLSRGRSGLVVDLLADRADTSRLLAGGAPALAHDLRAHGLGLESVNVSSGGHASPGGHDTNAGRSAPHGLGAPSGSAGASTSSPDAPLESPSRRSSRAGGRSSLDLLA